MFCTQCGFSLPEGMSFCPMCGKPVKQVQRPVSPPAPEASGKAMPGAATPPAARPAPDPAAKKPAGKVTRVSARVAARPAQTPAPAPAEEPAAPSVPEVAAPAAEEPVFPSIPDLVIPPVEIPEAPPIPDLVIPPLGETVIPPMPDITIPAVEEPVVPPVPEPAAPAAEEPPVPPAPEPATPVVEEPIVPPIPEPAAPAEKESQAPASDSAAGKPAAEKPQEKGKKKSRSVLFIALGAVLVLAVGVGVFFLLHRPAGQVAPQTAQAPVNANLIQGGMVCQVGGVGFLAVSPMHMDDEFCNQLTMVTAEGDSYTQTAVLDGYYTSLTAYQGDLFCIEYLPDGTDMALVRIDLDTLEKTRVVQFPYDQYMRIVGVREGQLYFALGDGANATLYHTDGTQVTQDAAECVEMVTENGIYALYDGNLRLVTADGRMVNNFSCLRGSKVIRMYMEMGDKLYVELDTDGIVCLDMTNDTYEALDEILRSHGVDTTISFVADVNCIGQRVLCGLYNVESMEFTIYSLEPDGTMRSFQPVEGSMDLYVLDDQNVMLREFWTDEWQVMSVA